VPPRVTDFVAERGQRRGWSRLVRTQARVNAVEPSAATVVQEMHGMRIFAETVSPVVEQPKAVRGDQSTRRWHSVSSRGSKPSLPCGIPSWRGRPKTQVAGKCISIPLPSAYPVEAAMTGNGNGLKVGRAICYATKRR